MKKHGSKKKFYKQARRVHPKNLISSSGGLTRGGYRL